MREAETINKCSLFIFWQPPSYSFIYSTYYTRPRGSVAVTILGSAGLTRKCNGATDVTRRGIFEFKTSPTGSGRYSYSYSYADRPTCKQSRLTCCAFRPRSCINNDCVQTFDADRMPSSYGESYTESTEKIYHFRSKSWKLICNIHRARNFELRRKVCYILIGVGTHLHTTLLNYAAW